MKQHSAGIIVFRRTGGQPEVLLAHMGAPWWANKHIGAWSVPKGLVEEGEEPFETAKREFTEELGLQVPEGDFIVLGDIQQQNNKKVTAWAIEDDINADKINSNTFKAEWPPRSGKVQEFPEIDKAGWFSLAEAAKITIKGQAELFERLANALHVPFGSEEIPGPPQQPSLF